MLMAIRMPIQFQDESVSVSLPLPHSYSSRFSDILVTHLSDYLSIKTEAFIPSLRSPIAFPIIIYFLRETIDLMRILSTNKINIFCCIEMTFVLRLCLLRDYCKYSFNRNECYLIFPVVKYYNWQHHYRRNKI